MLNLGALVLAPAMAAFAQPITFSPLASQPGQAAYPARGSYSLKPVEMQDEGGETWHQTHRHALGIWTSDFATLPRQGDQMTLPSGTSWIPGLLPAGTFEVTNVELDGQGGADLTLKKIA